MNSEAGSAQKILPYTLLWRSILRFTSCVQTFKTLLLWQIKICHENSQAYISIGLWIMFISRTPYCDYKLSYFMKYFDMKTAFRFACLIIYETTMC